MGQLISIGYGKENFGTAGVSLSSFVVTKPFIRALPSKKFKRQGNVQTFPASNRPDINGMLYQDTLDADEGTILLIQSSHTFKGAKMRDGAFFFQVRKDGPMTLVKANLPAARESLNDTKFLILQARGDVISWQEACEIADLELYDNFTRTWFNAKEIEECFIFQHTDPGKPRPKMEKLDLADGTQATVSSGNRARRVRVR